MATRSVKFEISIEKLSVKFEGDIQTAEQIQNQITGAINNLASAQNRMIASGRSTPAPASVDATPVKRRRKRRKVNEGIDTSVLDGEEVVDENGGESPAGAEDGAPRRRTGSAVTALVSSLKANGYFETKRTLGDVRNALGEKGHVLRSTDVNPALVRLTRDETLRREKNAAKQWVYFAP